MSAVGNIEDVAQLIQLAVAPIFLLTAVATTLMVLTSRLGRIVDRGRWLETQATDKNKHHRDELYLLERRAHLIYRALWLGVCAGICVCLLMTFAFAGALFQFNAARLAAWLFIGALVAYTGGLMCLLREVFLAVVNFRLGIHTVANPRRR